MLSNREAFKVAFLLKCAQDGLTMEETLTTIKHSGVLDWLKGPVGAAVGAATGMGRTAKTMGLIGLAAAPVALGAGAGYGAAKLTALNDEDPEEMKTRELIEETRRRTHELRLQEAMKQYRQSGGRSGRPLI